MMIVLKGMKNAFHRIDNKYFIMVHLLIIILNLSIMKLNFNILNEECCEGNYS